MYPSMSAGKAPEQARVAPERARKAPERARKAPERARKAPERARKAPERARKAPAELVVLINGHDGAELISLICVSEKALPNHHRCKLPQSACHEG